MEVCTQRGFLDCTKPVSRSIHKIKESVWILPQISSMLHFSVYLRICFEIILSLAERYFGIDLRCQGAVNSGLFTSLDRVKMPKRASDKPKKQILKHISDNFKTDSKALFGIFVLSVLANRPLFAANRECKSTQK